MKKYLIRIKQEKLLILCWIMNWFALYTFVSGFTFVYSYRMTFIQSLLGGFIFLFGLLLQLLLFFKSIHLSSEYYSREIWFLIVSLSGLTLILAFQKNSGIWASATFPFAKIALTTFLINSIAAYIIDYYIKSKLKMSVTTDKEKDMFYKEFDSKVNASRVKFYNYDDVVQLSTDLDQMYYDRQYTDEEVENYLINHLKEMTTVYNNFEQKGIDKEQILIDKMRFIQFVKGNKKISEVKENLLIRQEVLKNIQDHQSNKDIEDVEQVFAELDSFSESLNNSKEGESNG